MRQHCLHNAALAAPERGRTTSVAEGESQLGTGSNHARAVCAVFMAVQKHTNCFWHHQGQPQHCCPAATCESECCNVQVCDGVLSTGSWLGSSTMPLASCCGARTSCARPDAVKEWRRKLQQVECATGTTTPRASNAIEHGSLPYALREKNFAALSRTPGFLHPGDHKVWLVHKCHQWVTNRVRE